MGYKIGIIGVGNLGSSIANGLLNSGFSPENLILSEYKKELLHSFENKNCFLTTNNSDLAQKSDIIIVAVKPFKLIEIVDEIKLELNTSKVLVSVVTGIKISEIVDNYGVFPVARVMPNTAISVKESISCISTLNCNGDQKQAVIDIFNNLGEVVEIDENLMDAATVLGACGIAYVMRFLRAMTQGGIEIGFSADTANKIAIQTMKGATELLLQNKTHPEQEIDKVTTPKGCTIAGLNEMEHQGFSSALIKGVITSFEKI